MPPRSSSAANPLSGTARTSLCYVSHGSETAVGTLRPLWFRPGAPPARGLPPTAHLDLLRPLARGLASRLATVRYALRSSAARPRSGLSFLPSHVPFRGPPGMPTDCYSSGSPTLPPFGLSSHCSGLLSLVI